METNEKVINLIGCAHDLRLALPPVSQAGQSPVDYATAQGWDKVVKLLKPPQVRQISAEIPPKYMILYSEIYCIPRYRRLPLYCRSNCMC